MNTMTVSGFRKNMAAAFNKAAEGEDVIVRRGTQIFAIVPVKENDITITPELKAKIKKARDEYNRGESITLKTHEDIDSYFDSL